MNMDELLEVKAKSKGKLKKVKMKKASKGESFYKNENIPFEKRYTRLTTYVRKDLNHKMRRVKKLGKVKSITAFINVAIINQLKRY